MAERLGWRFAKLCAASTTSALGSGLATIAAPLFVASRTSNPLLVSATFGVSWLPWLLFALPGGVLVDRADRRRLMIVDRLGAGSWPWARWPRRSRPGTAASSA